MKLFLHYAKKIMKNKNRDYLVAHKGVSEALILLCKQGYVGRHLPDQGYLFSNLKTSTA